MILTLNMRGAGFMMASMAAFTFNDVCVKLLAGTLPLMQIVFLRGILTVGMMIGLARVMGLRRLTIPRGDRWLVAGRTGAEVASMVAFLIALINMPIANVSAVMAGAVVLNEPVGWKRLSAILVGMIGVLLIVQPGGDGFNAYSLVALIAVILITAREMFTRRFSAEVPSMAVAVITALSVCAFGGIATLVTGEWAPVEPRAGALVAIAAVFIIGGYVFSIMVMRVGEIGFVAPFRYTMLIWALVLGWLVFGDWPNAFTQAGAVIVVATGVFTLYRERRVRQGDG